MLRDLKKLREYAKNWRECTKILKVVENNHLRLETSENYKYRYSLLYIFLGFRIPHQGGFTPLDPSQGPLPLDATKCCEI